MILRKPYAFLIKHFKIIHLIITALIVYVAFNTSNILNYINDFFKTETGKVYAPQYINYWIIAAIVVSIIIVGTIIWLMKYKNKPRFIYYCYIIAYILTIIVIVISFNELNAIFTIDYSLKGLKAVRDLLKISLIFQCYFIFCMLVRGLGFDIKRFNFKKDLEEFNINETDNEEVEISFDSNNNTLTRKGRRTLRELKYYYLENKTMINIILVITIAIVTGYIIADKTVVNATYYENDFVNSGNYKLGVISSYITNSSSTNKKILSNDESFCIVKLSINTTNGYKYKINPDYLNLEINNTSYIPINKYNKYFSDIGISYKDQYITEDTKYFILIYKIKNSDINSKIQFSYQGNYENGSHVTFNLTPINLEIQTKTDAVLGNKLELKNSILNTTAITINNYEINNKYEYNYCYQEDCSYTATIYSNSNNILKLDIDSTIDNSVKKTWNDILNNYVNIYYTIDNTTYTSLINYAKTPSDINNNIYIEVDKKIENATSIWLEFNIRNQIYKYVLKG